MSLKREVIIWCAGALTTLIIVGVFWTVCRVELDAARTLVMKADATFQRANQLLAEIRPEQLQAMAHDLKQLIGYEERTQPALQSLMEHLQAIEHDLKQLIEARSAQRQ